EVPPPTAREPIEPAPIEEGPEETPLAPTGEIDQVTFRPLAPRPSLFQPIQEETPLEESIEETLKPFIPPQAEKPVRAPRMPRIDELPVPAQNELRVHRGEAADGGASLETRRMTLLQRLP